MRGAMGPLASGCLEGAPSGRFARSGAEEASTAVRKRERFSLTRTDLKIGLND